LQRGLQEKIQATQNQIHKVTSLAKKACNVKARLTEFLDAKEKPNNKLKQQ
jgi:hypothetical protein